MVKQFFKSRRGRLFLIAVVLLLLVYVVGSIYAAHAFTSVPNRAAGPYSPGNYNLKYDEVAFQSAASDHLTLRGWWIPHPNSRRVLVLVHVKNGDRSFGLPLVKPLWDNGYSLLLFDLRGHGASDGDRFTYGQSEQYDIVAAVNFAKAKGFAPDNIGVLGWSMGAASSLLAMAQTTDIKAAVLDSGYGDLARLAQGRLGWLLPIYPGMALAGQTFFHTDIASIKPEQALQKIGSRHVMLIHSDADTTVPISEYYALKAAGGASVTDTWELAGVGHAEAMRQYPQEYLRRVLAFFDRELGR